MYAMFRKENVNISQTELLIDGANEIWRTW